MNDMRVTDVAGYGTGDTLRISCEMFDSRVVSTTPTRILVAWPWFEVDEESENRWDGTRAFPRDPDHYDWGNIPWRVEPDPSELGTGDPCFVGMPATLVRVMSIAKYDPPADYGFLPRPEVALGLCAIGMLDEEEAGFTLYLDSGEPIEIEVVSRASRGTR